MDLPDTWTNYKSLLEIIAKKNQKSAKDFLTRLCSPTENFKNSTKLTRLFALAVEFKNCEIVSVLLEHGVRGKPCEELFKYTPMQCAVISGYVSLIREMLKFGATYNEIDNDGNTLLHLAILNKHERWKNIDINGSKKLIKCVTEDVIVSMFKILLDLGLDIDAQNNKGETPLSLAIQYRTKEVTELLLQHNASLKIFDTTVTHYLIMDEIETCERIEKNSDFTEVEGPWTKQQKSDFMHWWFSKKIDLNSRVNDETPLQLCMRYNMKNVLQVLLNYTDDIHQIDSVGRTLLHIVIGSIDNSLRVNGKNCEFEKVIDIMKMLIERGISVDKTDKCGNTPFHIAAKLKRPEAMQTIIAYFHNVNACNNMGETALHVLVKYCHDEYEDEYFEIVSTLVAKGADIDCQDRSGRSPLHLACLKNSDISKKIVGFFIKKYCNINIRDENGTTPLHLAIQTKSPGIVDLLIKNRANVNCWEYVSKTTPLHEATKKNLSSVVESLLKAGAKPDMRNILGQTPLHIAVSDRLLSPVTMTLLLNYGADAEVLDNKHKTPIYGAFNNHDYKRVEMLLNFGAKVTGIEILRLIPARSEASTYNSKSLIIKYLVAQYLAGFPVRNCYETLVHRAKREYASFYERCLREVDLLKATMIEDVSVYELLHMNLKRRFSYMSREAFSGFARDYEYLKDKFPLYRSIISGSYWTAMRRKPLFDSAKLMWYRLTNTALPEICVEEILGYLENSDLKFVIEAGR